VGIGLDERGAILTGDSNDKIVVDEVTRAKIEYTTACFRVDFPVVKLEKKEAGDGLIDRVRIAESEMPREACVRVPDQL